MFSGFSFLSVMTKCEKLHYTFSKALGNVTDSLVCFRRLPPSTKPSVIMASFPNITTSNHISLNVDSIPKQPGPAALHEAGPDRR